MAKQSVPFFSLNRGEVSLLALARVDIEHLRLAAQSQINWLPRVLGPMMLRPGWGYIGEILNDNPCHLIPYVSAFDDTAIIELTQGNMRIWRDDALVTRAAVQTTVPDFPSWTVTTTGTAAATTGAGVISFGGMNNGATAEAHTAVSVLTADKDTEHAIRLTVPNGPVAFMIGSQAGLADIFASEVLDTGTYSLAFTPGITTIYVTIRATKLANNSNTTTQSIPTWAQTVYVQNLAIEGPGVLVLPAPWTADQIVVPGVSPSTIRHDQSANIIFVAARGSPQYQINRYSPTSWSIVNYRPVKGPMAAVPSNASITLSVAASYGNTTLTASSNLFTASDVGTLFRLFTSGQHITETLSFSNTFTDAFEVTGVSYVSTIDGGGAVVNTATTDRNFTFTISGTWVGTIRLQRSFTSSTAGFSDYKTYTTNQAGITITDGLNNEIVWYRFGFNSGDLTSGAAVVAISYGGGGSYGVCHVVTYTSPTVVNVEVLVPFWNLSPTSDWIQSEWSASAGYPTSVGIHEGRLWWAGADKWWGSVSDDYSNFDYDATGDAAPIDQSIGAGPISNINWLVSIDHLVAGADTSIITAMSDAIESPLTPTNFTLRRSVTNGSFQVQAVPVDQRIVFIDQSGRRLYDLVYDIKIYNYKPTDLTRLNPDIGAPGFLDLAVQRQPDTRISLIRKDGVIVCMIYDVDDDVQAFWRIVTDGNFESITVMPGGVEDSVYACVSRTVNGVTKRYLEKAARIDECQGGVVNKNVDCHLVYSGAATNVLAGFSHLVKKTVDIWGKTNDDTPIIGDLGSAVVALDGTVTIPGGVKVTDAVVGLHYDAEFISAKLEYAAREGPGINKIKRISKIGFSMVNTHCKGVRHGAWTPNDEENTVTGLYSLPPVLDDLPEIEYGEQVPANKIWAQYDTKMIEFNCDSDTDNRVYLQASSPRPATVLGITFDIESSG